MSQPPWLRIEGARQNNLKTVSVAIPHDRVTVITGVSGSGKSSLAFDTLVRGRAVALHRVALHLRADVPRAAGPSRRRPHRAHPSRDRHRAEESRAHGPLDGGHVHRAPRLPAAALRQDRARPLPSLRRRGAGATRPSRWPTRWSVTTRARGRSSASRCRDRRPRIPPRSFAALLQRGFARVKAGDVVLDLADAAGQPAKPPADLSSQHAERGARSRRHRTRRAAPDHRFAGNGARRGRGPRPRGSGRRGHDHGEP